MKAFILTILATITLSISYSQTKQANWWYFGRNASLNFNKMVSGFPTAAVKGALSAIEGSASISDKNGNLLFYTDGVRVWDKTHRIMYYGTGLKGSPSSTQAAIIVPFPGNKNKFYIFTTGTYRSSNTDLHYTVVDMSLRLGLGDVDTSKKNVKIYGAASERVVVTVNSNGGYWLVSQQATSNKYSAYSVTSSGVSTTAVVSTLGPVSKLLNDIGYMKASTKGNKIGVCYYSTGGKAFIMDFNAKTGKLNNVKVDSVGGSFYGLEFSHDGSKLYVADYNGSKIRQYDATASTDSVFNSSKKIILAKGVKGIYAMQLGPDKKIYIASFSTQLAVIRNPNASGSACNLDSAGPVIPSGGRANLGLPTFPTSFFNSNSLNFSGNCVKSVIKFSLSDTSNIDSVLVNFGDTSSGLRNWTKLLPDTHSFAQAGNYWATAYLYSIISGKLVIDTVKNLILISEKPSVKLGKDTILCKFDRISAKIKSSISYSLYWNDSNRSISRRITKAGKHWITVSNDCGVGSDTIVINQLFHDSIFFGNDTVFCLGDSIKFEVKDKSSKYKWSTGDSTFSIYVKHGGIIWVEKRNVCGVFKAKILAEQIAPPKVNLGNDKTICEGKYESFGKATRVKYSKYLWNNGSLNSYIVVKRVGVYDLKVSNACGVGFDTVELFIDSTLFLYLGVDTAFCQGDSILLKPRNKLSNYLWSTNSKDSSIWVSKSGTYKIYSSNVCGTFTGQVTINENQPIVPSITRDADTLISSIANTYQWYSSGAIITNETKQKYTLISTGNFKVFTTDTNGCDSESKVSVIEVIYADTVKVPDFVRYNNLQNGEIKLFPNPVRNTLTIEFNEIEDQEFTLQIFDNKGALVLDENISVSGQGNSKTIDFKNFAKGEYLIRFSNSKSVNSFRVVKVE